MINNDVNDDAIGNAHTRVLDNDNMPMVVIFPLLVMMIMILKPLIIILLMQMVKLLPLLALTP